MCLQACAYLSRPEQSSGDLRSFLRAVDLSLCNKVKPLGYQIRASEYLTTDSNWPSLNKLQHKMFTVWTGL